jgi:hypothetical protein
LGGRQFGQRGEKRLCHWSLIRAKELSFFFALESSSRSLIFDQLS